MTEKENKAVVNAEMEEAIAEAHLPEVIIDDGAEKQEESLARPARMITDDFDQDNPVEFIHPEDEIRLKWSEIRNDASRRRIKNCEVLGLSLIHILSHITPILKKMKIGTSMMQIH